CFMLFIDLVAFVAQCSVYFIATSTQYTPFLSKTTTTPSSIDNQQLSDSDSNSFNNYGTGRQTLTSFGQDGEQPRLRFGWEAPVALFCVSIVWWENYVDRDIHLGKLKFPIGTYKRHLQSVRSKANIGASIWKIALTASFSLLLLPQDRFDNVFVSYVTTARTSNLDDVSPALVSAGTATEFNSFDSQSNIFGPDWTDAAPPKRKKRQIQNENVQEDILNISTRIGGLPPELPFEDVDHTTINPWDIIPAA
ncbi:unnamed protein product, partial [Didymodactylos carnosus]